MDEDHISQLFSNPFFLKQLRSIHEPTALVALFEAHHTFISDHDAQNLLLWQTVITVNEDLPDEILESVAGGNTQTSILLYNLVKSQEKGD